MLFWIFFSNFFMNLCRPEARNPGQHGALIYLPIRKCQIRFILFYQKCDCKSGILEWRMKTDRRFRIGFQGNAVRKRRKCPEDGVNAGETKQSLSLQSREWAVKRKIKAWNIKQDFSSKTAPHYCLITYTKQYWLKRRIQYCRNNFWDGLSWYLREYW